MTASLPDYFHDRIVIDGTCECWLWVGARNWKRYGVARTSTQQGMAHRLVWEMLRGPIPDGKQMDHLCRIRCCVNPDHLEPVSPRVNTIRGRNGCFDRSKMHSRYLGVSRLRNGRWVTNIHVAGDRRHLGTFDSEIDAALAHDAAVRELLEPGEPTNESLGLLAQS